MVVVHKTTSARERQSEGRLSQANRTEIFERPAPTADSSIQHEVRMVQAVQLMESAGHGGAARFLLLVFDSARHRSPLARVR